ncbi:MAG: gluconate 2-dehydrogenase subunit 3 family protein [Acidimicrobiales bacterium]
MSPAFFDDDELAVVAAASDRLVPGASDARVAVYIDRLLGAFSFDPPRLFAGGPFSGRHGGEAGFERWIAPNRVQALAWRMRIEGTNGGPERAFNGEHSGWQAEYRAGLAALGADFVAVDAGEQDARLDADPPFKSLLYQHACEGMYGDPVYGGNNEGAGWASIGYVGDVQPRGYTPLEVSGRERGDIT